VMRHGATVVPCLITVHLAKTTYPIRQNQRSDAW
jgi:hypothetical protein